MTFGIAFSTLGLSVSSFITMILFAICVIRNRLQIPIKCLDSQFWLIVLFSISYVIFNAINGVMRIQFVIHPIMYYLLGQLLIYSSREKEASLCRYVWGAIVGMFLHVLLTYFYNGISTSRYYIVDIWNKQYWNPTGISACLSFSVGLLVFAYKSNLKRVVKIALAIQSIVAMYLSLWLGSRTLIVISGATIVSAALLSTKGKVKKIAQIIIAFLFLGAVLYFLYKINFGEIRTRILSSNLLLRYSEENLNGSDDRRVSAFVEGVTGLFHFPFGGNTELHYAHNLWLDVGRQAGVIPAALLLAFFIKEGKALFSYFISQKDVSNYMLLIGPLFVAFTLNCFVEPILNGMELQFLVFLMIIGMSSAYRQLEFEENDVRSVI